MDLMSRNCGCPYWDPHTISQSIWWQPPNTGITIMKLFANIRTILVAILEVGLTVQRYINMDNVLVFCKAGPINGWISQAITLVYQ